MGAALQLLRGGKECQKDIRGELFEAGKLVLEEVVDLLMAKEKLDLEELSALLLEEGTKITRTLLEKRLQQEADDQSKEHLCPDCGKLAKVRNTRVKRVIETRHGKVDVERPYYYCMHCKTGFHPFDEEAGLAPQRQQYDLQKGGAILLSRLPYGEAAQVFKELTGQTLSDHALHGIGARLGESADLSTVLPSAKQVEEKIDEMAEGRKWRPIVVVTADGAMEPTRPETGTRKGKRGAGSYQEAKGFRIYLTGQSRIEQLMSWHQIANEEEFGEALSFAATLVPQDKVRVALIADGAHWVWKHFSRVFPEGKEILDYYHCSEHIHKFAHLQFPDDEAKAAWADTTLGRLYFGEVDSVIWGLQRMNPSSAEAERERDSLVVYLKNNSHRTNYDSFKRGGYPRGSGAIESANKFICHKRMKLSGAWWYKINGNRMLKLRCSLFNGTFDEVYRKYKAAQTRGAVKPKKTSLES